MVDTQKTTKGVREAPTASQKERIHALVQTVGIKGEFARTAKRLMRETPEYAQAKRDGEARGWLNREADSFAESAYMLLQQRLGDLDA